MTGLYLDVETTFSGRLTVVGLHHGGKTVQLVGERITRANLLLELPAGGELYTYNGERFDLPVIKRQLDVDLKQFFRSVDLMKRCHRAGLHGGLKRVEQVLGIHRELVGVSGKDAITLWDAYERKGDEEALAKLLAYNREDVENLVVLREKLAERFK